MSKIVSFLRISATGIASDPPTGVSIPDWSKAQWQEAMILNAQRINQKRKKKIPDQPRYDDKIAGPSIKPWGKFIAPNFVSRSVTSVMILTLWPNCDWIVLCKESRVSFIVLLDSFIFCSIRRFNS